MLVSDNESDLLLKPFFLEQFADDYRSDESDYYIVNDRHRANLLKAKAPDVPNLSFDKFGNRYMHS